MLQRHEAGAQDLANALGHGRQVVFTTASGKAVAVCVRLQQFVLYHCA